MSGEPYFRAELEERLVAIVRINERGAAYRLSRSTPTWRRAPELDRLARGLPGDLIFWDPVDEDTARSGVAQLGGIWASPEATDEHRPNDVRA